MTQDDRDDATWAESNRAAFTQAPRETSTRTCFAAANGLPGSQVNR